MVLVVFWVQTCIRRKYLKNTDWRHSWFFSSQARCSIQMSKRVSTKYTLSGPCSPPIICRRRILIIAWDGKLALAISLSNRKMPFLTTLDILRYLWISISWILLTICCKLSRDAIMRQLNQAWAVSDSELNKYIQHIPVWISSCFDLWACCTIKFVESSSIWFAFFN